MTTSPAESESGKTENPAGAQAGFSDRELLRRYTSLNDQTAFALILTRYGGMVYSVCRRQFADANDVDDAFQATFVALVFGARTIRNGEALPGWLHRTAVWICKKARRDKASQLAHEKRAAMMNTAASAAESGEMPQALDEEMQRLPLRYRDPLVLCAVRGMNNEEAAAALGVPVNTLRTRLLRGREMLRKRLKKCGVVLSVTGLAALLTPEILTAAPPPPELAHSTLALGKSLTPWGAVPANLAGNRAVALGRAFGDWRWWVKVKAATAAASMLGAAGAGVLAVVLSFGGQRASVGQAEPQLQEAVPAPQAEPLKVEPKQQPEQPVGAGGGVKIKIQFGAARPKDDDPQQKK